ncbi:MAG: hypothetical protein Q8P67_18945 [archaeon]|nr:hypothetical protein [archaeon]
MASSIPELDLGNSLFVNEDFHGAREAFSRGLGQHPGQPDLLARRSATLLKLKDFSGALADATAALQADSNHLQALLRQGIAAYSLERFSVARDALARGLALAPADGSLKGTFREWLDKAEQELARTTPSATAIPSSSPAPSSEETSSPSLSSSSIPVEILEESTYRREWHQSPTHVTVEFFVRDTKAEQCTIDIQAAHFSLVVRLEGGHSEYRRSFSLCDQINPATVRIEHLRSKISIRMEKQKLAHWKDLEGAADGAGVTQWFAGDPDAPPASHYPTSAREKKDWTKIASEVEEEKPSGDAALNKVFQDIYANGSDEQRRAMIKSFQESGGTVLSTNWQDVGARKVEVTPPKGLEVRSWQDDK